jgi:glyoxylase-like metal-dependent hydrolase (beta-lactamase superfamily II)
MTGRGNVTYALAGRDGATLIDAGIGTPEHLDDLLRFLTQEGVPLRSVHVTHGHVDHVSGATTIGRAHPSAAFSKYPWEGEDARHAVVWRPLADGDRLPVGDEELVVIHTPGHSPDHVTFWHEDSKTLFSGDLVILEGSVVIPVSRGGDLAAYLRSLERVRALEPCVLLPGHGRAITSPALVLTNQIEHRLRREQQVIEALASGLGTVESITESIYDGLRQELTWAARENVRAHLQKLATDGRATEDSGRWHLA